MEKLKINLKNEFFKIDSKLVRKILNVLEDYSSSEISIKENNFVDTDYVNSEWLGNYDFKGENIKVEYYRKYKYSLKNSSKTEEYENTLTIFGEKETINNFKEEIFRYIKENP